MKFAGFVGTGWISSLYYSCRDKSESGAGLCDWVKYWIMKKKHARRDCLEFAATVHDSFSRF